MSCPLCNLAAPEPRSHPETMVLYFECESCGDFGIQRSSFEDLPTEKYLVDNLYIISGLTRQASDQGNKLILSLSKMKSIVDATSIPSDIYESMDLLLTYIKKNTKKYDQHVTLKLRDYPVVFGRDCNEFSFLLQKLCDVKYIDKVGEHKYRLTLDGWKRYEEIRRRRPASRQAFVAMWFDEETKEAWEAGIYLALGDTGYEPMKIDLLQHNEKICDKIIAEIRRSGLIIADFTGNRGGVYFEAGFALGLGIPVIWTCRKDWVDKLHFDTRQYNHITWESASELRGKLVDRILATIITV